MTDDYCTQATYKHDLGLSALDLPKWDLQVTLSSAELIVSAKVCLLRPFYNTATLQRQLRLDLGSQGTGFTPTVKEGLLSQLHCAPL